jgi:hypothetical protein
LQWRFSFISGRLTPLAGIASGVCSVANTFGLQSNSTSETCYRIQANEGIIQSAPSIAIIVGFLGLLAIIIGMIQMAYSRKKKQIKI